MDIRSLVKIYKTVPYAPYFFEAIAASEQPRPVIDIDRRRRAINSQYSMRIKKEEGEEVFSALAEVGIGKLKRQSGSGIASVFKLGEGISSAEFISLAQKTIESAGGPVYGALKKQEVPEPGAGRLMLKLPSGSLIQLTPEDVKFLRKFLESL